MTEVMTEGIAPCGGPAKGLRRKAATPEVQERTQERVTEVMTEGIAPVWRSRRSLSCQGLAAQGNNLGGMQFKSGLKNARLGSWQESVHQCGGPGGALEGCNSRADSRLQVLGLTAVSACWEGPAGAVQCLNTGVMAAVMAAYTATLA